MYRLFIDTPQELEQLKRGDYDNQGYDDVLVKQSASPNIYLEPQYFESNTFPRMQFYDDKLPANNGIILTNSLDSKKGAYANFAAGVQSLEGMPKNSQYYGVDFGHSAEPTDANVDTILGWKKARTLAVSDKGDLILTLLKRIDELSTFTDLSVLQFNIPTLNIANQFKVLTIIEKLPSLTTLIFNCHDLSEAESISFFAKNIAPSGWRGDFSYPREIRYDNIHADF